MRDFAYLIFVLLVSSLSDASQKSCNPLFTFSEETQNFYLDILAQEGHLARLLAVDQSKLPLVAAFDIRPTTPLRGILRILDTRRKSPQEVQHKIELFQAKLDALKIPYQRVHFFDPVLIKNFILATKSQYHLPLKKRLIASFTPTPSKPTWNLQKVSPPHFFKSWQGSELDRIRTQLEEYSESLKANKIFGFPIHLSVTEDGNVQLVDVENILLQNQASFRRVLFDPLQTFLKVQREWLQHAGL